jgi:hypothetical protein
MAVRQKKIQHRIKCYRNHHAVFVLCRHKISNGFLPPPVKTEKDLVRQFMIGSARANILKINEIKMMLEFQGIKECCDILDNILSLKILLIFFLTKNIFQFYR